MCSMCATYVFLVPCTCTCIVTGHACVQDAGVSFEIDGQEYTFRGTLTIVPGDNLASQYLGGYKSLSGALRKCRQCMAVDEDMQQQVHL